jgi:hypothetical protein
LRITSNATPFHPFQPFPNAYFPPTKTICFGADNLEARFLERNLQLLSQNQLTTYWFWVAQAWISCTQATDDQWYPVVMAEFLGDMMKVDTTGEIIL